MGLFSGIGKAFKGITGTVGGLLNNLTGVSDTANQSMSDQIKLWNMQNNYNTPSAQIARMADAGIKINPMTYAVGNGSMDTKASSIGSPSYSGSGINPIASAMNVVQGIKGMQVQNAEMERMAIDNQNKNVEREIMKHNLNLARHLNMPVGQTPLLYGQGQGIKSVASDVLGGLTGSGSSGLVDKVSDWLNSVVPPNKKRQEARNKAIKESYQITRSKQKTKNLFLR